jgi:hypothetical protein
MLLNIRYYVIMITSVFLALGIGIVIGFSLDGQEIFVQQQQGLIGELEQRFTELKNENTSLKSMVDLKEKELNSHRDFADEVFLKLVEGCLSGITVAVIECDDELVDTKVIDTLMDTGANVTSVTHITKGYIEQNPRLIIELKENLDEFVEDAYMHSYISKRLVNAIVTGRDKLFAEQMKDLGVIEVSGGYDVGVDYFILSGGGREENRERVEKIYMPIINAIKDSNIPLVGVERTDCEQSGIRFYKSLKISTVDNIDSIIGRYSLVKVLQGNEGHYGVKDTADMLIPAENTAR